MREIDKTQLSRTGADLNRMKKYFRHGDIIICSLKGYHGNLSSAGTAQHEDDASRDESHDSGPQIARRYWRA